MINNKTAICFIWVVCLLSACQSQNNKVLDLENIPKHFDVTEFYRERLAKTNEIITTDTKKMDRRAVAALLNYPLFTKDTLGYYSSEGRFPTEQYLESTSDWMTRKQTPSEIFGYQYRTVAFNEEKDTLAILNNVPFPKMNAVEDKEGNLMYLSVEKASDNSGYSKIHSYLEKNCKNVKVEDGESNSAYFENDRFFFVLKRKTFKQETIFSDETLSDKKVSTDKTEISLSIYTKAYISKMEAAKIYSAGIVFWKKQI